MIDKSDIQRRINEEEDYIRCPKCGNSINKFIQKNDDGAENSAIARFLMITEEEVEKLHQEAIEILREDMIED